MQKYILIIILIFMISIQYSYSSSIELNKEGFAHTFTFTDDNGEKTTDYLLNNFYGALNIQLKNIISKYPDALKSLKTGVGMYKAGGIILGIGIGSLIGMSIGIPIILISYYVRFGEIGLNYYLTNYPDFYIYVGVFGGIGLVTTVIGIILLATYSKKFEKGFEIFNDNENKKSLNMLIDINQIVFSYKF